MNSHEMKWAWEYIDDVQNGPTNVTIRFRNERKMLPGDLIYCNTPDNAEFHLVKVVAVLHCQAGDAAHYLQKLPDWTWHTETMPSEREILKTLNVHYEPEVRRTSPVELIRYRDNDAPE